jgi:hypothetical protein
MILDWGLGEWRVASDKGQGNDFGLGILDWGLGKWRGAGGE